MLIGLFLMFSGGYGATFAWKDLDNDSIPAAIVMVVVFIGTAIGGGVVMCVGGGHVQPQRSPLGGPKLGPRIGGFWSILRAGCSDLNA
jgi:hypothetical protein